jgi:pyrroloquinoline quinone (PQQ) biosynthesis protein C
MVSVDAFLETLQGEISAHEAVRHRFLRRFVNEPLSLEQIKTFGLQHYQLVKVFLTYMTNLQARISDPEVKRLFRKVFDDEFGAVTHRSPAAGEATLFRSHPALYRNFLRAIGLADEALGRVRILPETAYYIETHKEMTREQGLLVGLGAIGPGHEFSIPMMFEYLVIGLRKNTTLTEDEFDYFTLHIVEDQDHAKVFNEVIGMLCPSLKDLEKIREGALQSLALRKQFWDGLERAVFG